MASVRNGLVTVTIRLKPETIESLKEISREEGLGYQTHIRNVLEGHVEKNMVGYDCNESARPALIGVQLKKNRSAVPYRDI